MKNKNIVIREFQTQSAYFENIYFEKHIYFEIAALKFKDRHVKYGKRPSRSFKKWIFSFRWGDMGIIVLVEMQENYFACAFCVFQNARFFFLSWKKI